MSIYAVTRNENKKVVSIERLEEGFNLNPLYDGKGKRGKSIEDKIDFILQESEDILPEDYYSNLGNYLRQEARTEPVYTIFDNFLVDVCNKLENILDKKFFEDAPLYNVSMEKDEEGNVYFKQDKSSMKEALENHSKTNRKHLIEKEEIYLQPFIEEGKRMYEENKKVVKQILNRPKTLPEGWTCNIEPIAW